MVFTWYKYDNPAPFELIDGTFDTFAEANECLKKTTSLLMNYGVVFDRVEGNIVATKE